MDRRLTSSSSSSKRDFDDPTKRFCSPSPSTMTRVSSRVSPSPQPQPSLPLSSPSSLPPPLDRTELHSPLTAAPSSFSFSPTTTTTTKETRALSSSPPPSSRMTWGAAVAAARVLALGGSGNAVAVPDRPTEGQLRWAQFHSKARAERTQRAVARLMRTPPDDDDDKHQGEDPPPPGVSRGRMALLRASDAAYRKRRGIGGQWRPNFAWDGNVEERRRRLLSSMTTKATPMMASDDATVSSVGTGGGNVASSWTIATASSSHSYSSQTNHTHATDATATSMTTQKRWRRAQGMVSAVSFHQVEPVGSKKKSLPRTSGDIAHRTGFVFSPTLSGYGHYRHSYVPPPPTAAMTAILSQKKTSLAFQQVFKSLHRDTHSSNSTGSPSAKSSPAITSTASSTLGTSSWASTSSSGSVYHSNDDYDYNSTKKKNSSRNSLSVLYGDNKPSTVVDRGKRGSNSDNNNSNNNNNTNLGNEKNRLHSKRRDQSRKAGGSSNGGRLRDGVERTVLSPLHEEEGNTSPNDDHVDLSETNDGDNDDNDGDLDDDDRTMIGNTTDDEDDSNNDYDLDASKMLEQLSSKILSQSNAVIDSDRDETNVDGDGDGQNQPSSKDRDNPLRFSPSLLVKRYRQAVASIVAHNWDSVGYLLNANPWLAEMVDPVDRQSLLHHLALHGTDTPPDLFTKTLELCGDMAHTFDRWGNVPLHMAATRPNPLAIRLLLETFRGGAGIQNHRGMLPLHLAVLSGLNDNEDVPMAVPPNNDDVQTNFVEDPIVTAVCTLVEWFPEGTGVPDADGNLPLHLAGLLDLYPRGYHNHHHHHPHNADVCAAMGPTVCRVLAKHDAGVRISSAGSSRPRSSSSDSVETEDTDEPLDDMRIPSSIAHNAAGQTPLVMAITNHCHWSILEALLEAEGGTEAAMELAPRSTNATDDNNSTHSKNSNADVVDAETNNHHPDEGVANNALHLLLQEPYQDPACALSVLKHVPSIVSVPDGNGNLPIQLACRSGMPREVLLGILLIDLPIDLDNKTSPQVLPDLGRSWWYLVCDADDRYPHLIREVLGLCNYHQTRELCFLTTTTTQSQQEDNDCYHTDSDNRGTARSLLRSSTPRSRRELRRGLRFVGRYEFMGSRAVVSDPRLGLKVYDALDFGGPRKPNFRRTRSLETSLDENDDADEDQGRRVFLHCFENEENYLQEIGPLRQTRLSTDYVEEVMFFPAHEFEDYSFQHGSTDQSQTNGTSAPSHNNNIDANNTNEHNNTTYGSPKQYCISVERPDLTLQRIVSGMPADHEYRKDRRQFLRYLSKVGSVLRTVAIALRHLHGDCEHDEHGNALPLVHCDLGAHNVGKFGDRWKLLSVTSARRAGDDLERTAMSEQSPPEFVNLNYYPSSSTSSSFHHSSNSSVISASTVATNTISSSDQPPPSQGQPYPRFKSSYPVTPAVDIWAFGKLCYDIFVGEPLIPFGMTTSMTTMPLSSSSTLSANTDQDDDRPKPPKTKVPKPRHDIVALGVLGRWDETARCRAMDRVLESGVGPIGADFVGTCLHADPALRPSNMDAVLAHDFWTHFDQTHNTTQSPVVTPTKKGRTKKHGSVSLATTQM